MPRGDQRPSGFSTGESSRIALQTAKLHRPQDVRNLDIMNERIAKSRTAREIKEVKIREKQEAALIRDGFVKLDKLGRSR